MLLFFSFLPSLVARSNLRSPIFLGLWFPGRISLTELEEECLNCPVRTIKYYLVCLGVF